MSLHEPSPEDLQELGQLLHKIFNSGATPTEKQQAEAEMVQLIHQTFNSDDTLHRMANISEGKEENDTADIFAASAISMLMEQGLIPQQMPRVTFLYMKAILAHWIRTYERYLRQGEL